MQRTGTNAALNRGVVETQRRQLPPGNNPVLPARKPGDRLPPPKWWVFVAFFATNTHHLARVAGGALREGDLCKGWAMSGACGP